MSQYDGTHWLTPWERAGLIEALIASPAGLIKWDNDRRLPLKSGGMTDVYINLRDARSDPEAIALLSEVFGNPLRRLKVRRFVEVPDSVSCFAGPLSIVTGIPMATIRESPKEGRVTKSSMIGQLVRGERTIIIDDVVTDGASKVDPARVCLAAGVDLGPLVVLVDREQGWRKKFGGLNFDISVWSGMTLHHVRRHLIERGYMSRCRPDVEVKNPIIVACDGREWGDILPILDTLRPTGCIIKVNDLLLDEGIHGIIPDLSVYGRVMADLKGHDIPNTLGNIANRLRRCPPWAVTVHASGQSDMIAAVVKTLEGTPTKVLAVTVLTSLDAAACEEVYMRQPLAQVMKGAEIAMRAGAHGLVCSPEETTQLRKLYPNAILVNPGIRSPGADPGDQKRISTPKGAMDAGANHIVMGRQILGVPDPVAEVNRVLKEELGIQI